MTATAAAEDTDAPNRFHGWYAAAKLGTTSVDSSITTEESHVTTGVNAGHFFAIDENWSLGLNGFVDWVVASEHDITILGGGTADFGTLSYGLEGQAGIVWSPVMLYGKLGWAWANGTGDANDDDFALRFGAGVDIRVGDYDILAEWTRYETETLMGQDVEHDGFILGFGWRF
jgi:hypothetical protein